jgi:DNA-binding beta-propeller fold protein YncE
MNNHLTNEWARLSAVAGALTLLALTALAADGQERPPLERIAVIESKGMGKLDHVCVDAKNARLFLANTGNNTLDVMDLKTNKLLKQVAGQNKIHGIAYVAELDRLFVGNGEGVCNVLDGKDFTLLKAHKVKGADNVCYDPRTHHVFAAGDEMVAVIDAKTLELVASVKIPGSPHGVEVASKHPRFYINTGPPSQVVVIDTNSNEIVARHMLPADKSIAPLALDEANNRIFVGSRNKPRVAVLDLESGKEIASVTIGDNVDDLFYDAKAKRIYASCGGGTIAVIRQIDADRYEALTNVTTVKGAKTSTYDAGAQRLYLAVPRQEGKEGPEIWVYQARP